MPVPGFAQKQDRGVRRRHGLDLFEDAHQRRALADDLPGGEIAFDLRLEEVLLLGEFVLHDLEIPVDQGIVQGNRQLDADLPQQAGFLRREMTFFHAPEAEATQRFAPR